MQDFITSEPDFTSELHMYHCGTESCAPGHFYGPAVRDHFLIHYIHSGKGIFRYGGLTYQLQKGQGFLICPDLITYYQADFIEPWHYSWVGFQGRKAAHYLEQAALSAAHPIFRYDRDDLLTQTLSQMLAAKNLMKSRELCLQGLLYLFLGRLVEVGKSETYLTGGATKKEWYVGKALEFIRMNYSRKISIGEIAHTIGIDRSYFCQIFKECLKTSPQEYLIQFRIRKACDLMNHIELTIGDISRSVGYEDPFLFSKTFKRLMGVSPRDFRCRHLVTFEE